jgi:hypothetical protein
MREKVMTWREGAIKNALIIALIFCCAGCGITKQISGEDSSTTAAQTTYAATIKNLNTPQKIFDWMLVNLHYMPDQSKNDEFRSAELTYELRYGDCDDYANFASTILRQHGYQVEILSVFNKTQGHAVCVWQENDGSYNFLSNINIYYVYAKSYTEIASIVYKNWTYCQLYSSKEKIPRHL